MTVIMIVEAPMNQGVEILLARMDSHPEEFEPYGIWSWATDDIVSEIKERAGKPGLRSVTRVSFMADEELQALADKYASLQADMFTRKVMTQLLDPETINISAQYGSGLGGVLGSTQRANAKLTK
jgi:hypothetical protein